MIPYCRLNSVYMGPVPIKCVSGSGGGRSRVLIARRRPFPALEAASSSSASVFRDFGAGSAVVRLPAVRFPGEASFRRRIFAAASACAPFRAGSVRADGCRGRRPRGRPPSSNPSAPRNRTLSSPRCSSNCISRPSKFWWNRVGSGLLRVRFRPRLGCRIWAACFPAFRFFSVSRSVRLFFVRGGAESVESLWTILVRAAFGFRVRGLD